jgi:hypothetical protein
MYRREPGAPASWSPDRWQDNELFLYGIDLFNHGYWWEAHAEWESLWRTCDRGASEEVFLRGLIQLSAACLKRSLGKERGARRLAEAAVAKLRRVPALSGSEHYMGVDTLDLARRAEASLMQHGLEPGRLRIPLR